MKIIIVGGGLVGEYVAGLLLEQNHQVCIIENNREVYQKLVEKFPAGCVTLRSGSDPSALESVGIDDADVLAAVTGHDETNLVVSTLAKLEYGVPKVFARVNHPKNQWLFNQVMGVDSSINQAELMADIIIDKDIRSCITK